MQKQNRKKIRFQEDLPLKPDKPVFYPRQSTADCLVEGVSVDIAQELSRWQLRHGLASSAHLPMNRIGLYTDFS